MTTLSDLDIRVRDGDTPRIEEVIVDEEGNPIALPGGASVTFVLQQLSPTKLAATSSAAEIVDAPTGQVAYTLTTAQTTLGAGQVKPSKFRWIFRVTAPLFQLSAPTSIYGYLFVDPSPDT